MRNYILEDAPLVKIALCLMAGIIMGDCWALPVPMLPILVGMVVVTMLLWKYEYLQSVAIAGCFAVLGALLVQWKNASMQTEWPKGEVCYEAVVMSEPVMKSKTVAVDIMLTGSGHKLKCYLYQDERSMNVRIGDGLKIQSRIKPNQEWHIGSFDYRRYLEVHGFTGTTFVSSWKWKKAQISLTGLSRLERTKLYFLQLRSRLLQRFSEQGFDEDQYAVVAAMALGDKSALTKELKDVYAVTGASHVLALSGLHLGMIYALLSLLVVGRRWRTISQILVIIGIWTYVFLVGMSVSVVRAAVMLSIYALLSIGHRDRMSLNTLAFTVLLLLIVNPFSLFDVGFQMSFIAVASIMLLVPLSEKLLSQEFLMDHRLVKWLWGLVTVSCAAQIGVAPLTAYYFGRFSSFFLLTNFIVIPAVTLILYMVPMVLIVPSLAYLLIYIVSGLNAVLGFISKLPGASIELHPTLLQTVMVYVILVALYLLVTYIPANVGYRSNSRQPSVKSEYQSQHIQHGS